MFNFVSEKNRFIQYDVVIVSVNSALKLVNEGSIQFSGDPQFVFCGTNNYYKNQSGNLNNVTVVVENKERTLELEIANKELLRLSNMDGLTQIYNRRYFDNTLSKEINRLQRTSTSISVLMCDIDFF